MGDRIVKNAGWSEPLMLALCAIALCGCPKAVQPPAAEPKTTKANAITPVVAGSDKAAEDVIQPSDTAAEEQPAIDVTPVASIQATLPPEP
ncbi:MAG TPA: hypothetical protein VGI40_06145, partial [Pirellulaceae bacterium]